MKRIYAGNDTKGNIFNSLQELIYQYKRYEKRVPAAELRSMDGFINFLIQEGYSYDYGD